MKTILLTILMLFSFMSFCHADSPGNAKNSSDALTGLTTAKAYFDVTVENPKLVLLRLQLIEKTYSQIAANGVTPAFIVGIRGKASNFFTKGNDNVLDMDLPDKKQIEILVKKFAAQHIPIEQCLIAAEIQHIDAADFLPQLKLVANGYVSMIGYQSQGYGLVPMD